MIFKGSFTLLSLAILFETCVSINKISIKDDSNLIYEYQGNKIIIRGNGEIKKSKLDSLTDDKVACGCTSFSKFTEINIISSNGRITSESSSNIKVPVFNSFSNLKIVKISGNVALGRYMFSNMVTLTTLMIDAAEIIDLSSSSFEGSSGLVDVVVSGKIKAGCWVFKDCYGLRDFYYCGSSIPTQSDGCQGNWEIFGNSPYLTVHVPFQSNITKFGEKATVNDSNLYTDGNGVKYFNDGTKLTIYGSGTISALNIAYIYRDLPQKCIHCSSNKNFTELTIHGVGNFLNTEIDGYDALFKSFTGLIRVNAIGLTNINDYAFKSLTSINSLYVESQSDQPILIGSYSFEGTGLIDVEIHNYIKLGQGVFNSCTNISSFFYCSDKNPKRVISQWDDWEVFKGSNMPSIIVHVPFQSNAMDFAEKKTVADGDLYQNGSTNFVFLGDKLRIYGNDAIESANSDIVLRSILNKGGKCGYCASYSDITEIVLEGDDLGRLSIPEWTLADSSYLGVFDNLKTITILRNVAINQNLVNGMTSIEKLKVFSNTTTVIGKYAFNNASISEYHFQGDISISDNAFHNCKHSIKDIYVCGSINYVFSSTNQHVFTQDRTPATFTPRVHVSQTSNIRSFDTVTDSMIIRDANMQTINSITYNFNKNNLTINGEGLVNKIDLNTIKYSSMCISCASFDKIESVVFNGRLSIDSYAFDQCASLHDVEFNLFIQIIPENAFSNCNIQYLTIPASVRQIQDRAFDGNSILMEIRYCGKSDPGAGSQNVFDHCPFISNAKVPTGYSGDMFCSVKAIKSLTNNECSFASLPFTKSMEFTSSRMFTITEDFSKSLHFRKSDIYSKSDVFSKSYLFKPSIGFPNSFVFSSTDKLSRSNNFLKSQEFSFSKDFIKTNHFSKTSDFTLTMIFSLTDKLDDTRQFSLSFQFFKTNEFKKTNSFSKSNQLILTNFFSKSKYILNSNNFSETIMFTESNKLNNTKPSSHSMKPENTNLISLSNNSRPIQSIESLESRHITKDVIDKLTSSMLITDQSFISNENIEWKSSHGVNIGIMVGSIVAIVVVIIIIIGIILICRHGESKELKNESADEMETENYSTEEETNSIDYTIGQTSYLTQDLPIWENTIDNQLMELMDNEQVNYNFEESLI